MKNAIDVTNNKFIFNNKNVLIVFDENNNPWFKGKDICDILEYEKSRNAIERHVDSDDKINFKNIDALKQGLNKIDQKTIFINESGLYSLILRSKKEEAKQFKKWVTKEVLPSIRKSGEYKLQNQLAIEFENKLKIKDDEIKTKDNEIKKLEKFKLNTKNFIESVKQKTKTGYIYIATCKRYAMINNFKIGKTEYLSSRSSSFNSSHNEEDRFYYCFYEKVYDMNKTERLIFEILDDFRDKKNKEIFVLHYKSLLSFVKSIIRHMNFPFDKFNEFIKNIEKNYEEEPFVPEEVKSDNDLREQMIDLLNEFISQNKVNISRKELLEKFDNKNEAWNEIKNLTNWKNSHCPINFNNCTINITY